MSGVFCVLIFVIFNYIKYRKNAELNHKLNFEIGTWAPTSQLGNLAVSEVTSSNYIKVGRLVYVYCTCKLLHSSQSSSIMSLQGLPYESQSTAVLGLGVSTLTNKTQRPYIPYIENSSIKFADTFGGRTWGNMTSQDFVTGNGLTLSFSGCYLAKL